MVSRSKKSGSNRRAPKWEGASFAAVQNVSALVEDNKRWIQSDVSESLVELESGLDKVTAAQRPKPTEDDTVLPSRTENDFLVFENWLRDQHGIDLQSLNLRLAKVDGEEDNVTIVATSKIPKGTQLISVPDTAMISTSQIAQLGLGSVLGQVPELAQDPSVVLVLVLLVHALCDDSKYCPYVRVLPRSFTTPFWPFKADTLLALRPSPAFHRGVSTIRALVRRYARVYGALRQLNLPVLPIEQFTLSRFMWAISVVMTRQNEIPSTPRALALVPVWDFCNHSPGTHSTAVAVSPETNQVTVECSAMHEFDVDQAVTICYGSRPNSELLLFSGFVQEDNLYDQYSLPLMIRSDDNLARLKLRLLEKAQVALYGSENEKTKQPQWVAKITAHSDGSISEEGLAVARVIVMDKVALTAFLRSSSVLPTTRLDDEQLEAKALALIASVAEKLLERYISVASNDVVNSLSRLVQRRAIVKLHTEERRLLEKIIETHQR